MACLKTGSMSSHPDVHAFRIVYSFTQVPSVMPFSLKASTRT